MKGNIFNIQKFSIHDGPGLRTTVFFKGCPLRCAWCSNPESQLSKLQISYDSKSCLHCGKCEQGCPFGCISLDKKGVRIEHEDCTGCLSCVLNCPGKALKAEGKLTEAEEIVRICMQDMDFYEESGGGVTFSGGECMYQSSFASLLADMLTEKGIHLAAETTGCVDSYIFRALAPKFQLLLFDIKHYDPQKHFEGTGVSNEIIIENLRWAYEKGLNILPRIPVIPGFNSSLEDAQGMAELISGIGLKKVQLLPFHQFGERKYEFLGRSYGFEGVKALHSKELGKYKNVFVRCGLETFF